MQQDTFVKIKMMQTIQHSIQIKATKENVWDVLWSDQTLRDWASIIDEGTYMDGTLQEGNEVNFISSNSGYGVASKVKKLIPNQYVSFIWTADIIVNKDGSFEKRKPQWEGGKETYEIETQDDKLTLTLTQEIPDELVEQFKINIPKALERVKVLAEMKLSEKFYPLSQLETNFIEQLRHRTMTAILIISITYIIALTLLVITLITSQISWGYLALFIPLLMYIWLITYGGIKHVNNHYGFKKTPDGIVIYNKQRVKYKTYTWVFILIFYVSSIIRLIREIRNLKIINAELISRSK